MTSTFIHKPKQKFSVHVDRQGRTWSFRVGKYQHLTKLKGGHKTAEKIAAAIRASCLRTESNDGIDGLARAQMKNIIGTRTLIDFINEQPMVLT